MTFSAFVAYWKEKEVPVLRSFIEFCYAGQKSELPVHELVRMFHISEHHPKQHHANYCETLSASPAGLHLVLINIFIH